MNSLEDIGECVDSLTIYLEEHEKELYSVKIDKCDQLDASGKERAKRFLALIKLQEKTISELRDQNNKLEMVVSVLKNSSDVLNRKFERLESSCRRVNRERELKEKGMKRFKIMNGRLVKYKELF